MLCYLWRTVGAAGRNFFLSKPGYIDFVLGLNQKYGSIVKVWIGPYLAVVLTEAKYVEVSKMVLA
jgi:hypothetical protein